MSEEESSGLVSVIRRGPMGHVTLNRPEAINALTLPMVRRLAQVLRALAEDDSVTVVLIDGAGDKGLCAGGDVVAVREAVLCGDGTAATFWAEEYRLNAYISEYPKPLVAVMDGIVMGGGVGISAHASHRITTERTRLAMPEVGIGFFPDVGGTWLLSRIPNEIGMHLGLTGDAIDGHDAVALGLADHVVGRDEIPALLSLLESGVDVISAVRSCSAPPRRSEVSIQDDSDWIGTCYRPGEVGEILQLLDGSSAAGAKVAGAKIRTKSPTSLVAARAAIERARNVPSLRDALEYEYALALVMTQMPDFVEGIRAVLVDKDRSPKWSPDRLADVDAAIRDVPMLDPPLSFSFESGASVQSP